MTASMDAMLEHSPLQPVVDAILQRVEALRQERDDLAARLHALDADMAILRRAADILLPGSSRSPESKKPRAKPSPEPNLSELVGQGRFAPALLEVLREAGEPLTAAEAGERTLQRFGHAPGTLSATMIIKRTATTLRRHGDRGVLRAIQGDDSILRWEVAR